MYNAAKEVLRPRVISEMMEAAVESVSGKIYVGEC